MGLPVRDNVSAYEHTRICLWWKMGHARPIRFNPQKLAKKRGSVDIVKDVRLKSYPVPQKVKAGRGEPVNIAIFKIKNRKI